MRAECPDAERLVAYLTAQLRDAERDRIDAHLLTCDGCTAAVIVMHQRWRMADHVAVRVPAALADEVTGRLSPVHSPQHSLWSRVRERLIVLTRLPILMPSAFAMGVIVMLLAQQIAWQPSGPLTRAVSLAPLRVRASAVRIYEEPDSQARVLATLPAGTIVDVRDQNQEWYRIVLPDGRAGWVEQAAIE